jgi:hypothetical protein
MSFPVSIIFDAERGEQLARDFESSYGTAERLVKGDALWLTWTELSETAVIAAMTMMQGGSPIWQVRVRNPHLTPVDDCGE